MYEGKAWWPFSHSYILLSTIVLYHLIC